MIRSLIILFVLIFIKPLYSQDTTRRLFSQNYFRLPLNLPPSLAGSFGEIRSNHFHSGLDFRTNQREGYPVYAVADGFVSRLRVQVGGFGNAIYLTHPNGYTSVYAHLQKFNDRIGQVVKSYQYRQESYDVDFPLIPIEIPVKKGDVIGYSGNTGSSGGPHLHFEIRDSKTEQTLNPVLFGYDIPDKVKPIIQGLYMYRLNGKEFSEDIPRQYFQVTGTNGNYRLTKSPTINFNGEVGFGVMTFDQQFPNGNHNGVYSIELQMDGSTIFNSRLDGFFFHNSRAVNSHLDYPSLLLYGRRIQKSFIEPGNPLLIYQNVVDRGIVRLQDERAREMRYVIKDANGNTSTLAFQIQLNTAAIIPVKETVGERVFRFDVANEFITESAKISIPKGSLYSDLNFNYSTSAKTSKAFSGVHNVHSRLTPIHNFFSLAIRADSSLSARLHDKAVIVDTRGRYHGGEFSDGFVRASPRSFGSFYISVDTIPPVITPVNVSNGKSVEGTKRIVFKVRDNLSGIREIVGRINGQWVLMEYDLKTATVWHTFDEITPSGKLQLQLIVSDMKKNTKTYNATIYR